MFCMCMTNTSDTGKPQVTSELTRIDSHVAESKSAADKPRYFSIMQVSKAEKNLGFLLRFIKALFATL